jgi:hypothetical protein
MYEKMNRDMWLFFTLINEMNQIKHGIFWLINFLKCLLFWVFNFMAVKTQISYVRQGWRKIAATTLGRGLGRGSGLHGFMHVSWSWVTVDHRFGRTSDFVSCRICWGQSWVPWWRVREVLSMVSFDGLFFPFWFIFLEASTSQYVA